MSWRKSLFPTLILAAGVMLAPATGQAAISNPTGVFGTTGKITCTPNFGKVNCTLPAVVQIGTSLAIGGATIGSDALAINGSMTISSTLNANGSILGAGTVRAGVSSQIQFGTTRSRLSSDGDGNLVVTNAAGASFGLFKLGGTTSSFAALKLNGTGLSARLADDSANTSFTASILTLSAIAADTGQTDSTVCVTSAGLLLKGTGTLGICLGTSSARYKHDIEPMQAGLTQILALKPSNFFYNKGHGDNGARKQYGLIAEDVANVLPGLVGFDNQKRPNSVDLVGMVPILIKADQELAARIAALEAANESHMIKASVGGL